MRAALQVSVGGVRFFEGEDAVDDGRQDIANTVSMFLAGLNRIYEEAKAPVPVAIDEGEDGATEA